MIQESKHSVETEILKPNQEKYVMMVTMIMGMDVINIVKLKKDGYVELSIVEKTEVIV